MVITKKLQSHPSNRGKLTRSFGNKFRLIAEEAEIRYQDEFFETNLIKIHESDFRAFIDSLIQ